jgi:hypothetical protein
MGIVTTTSHKERAMSQNTDKTNTDNFNKFDAAVLKSEWNLEYYEGQLRKAMAAKADDLERAAKKLREYAEAPADYGVPVETLAQWAMNEVENVDRTSQLVTMIVGIARDREVLQVLKGLQTPKA